MGIRFLLRAVAVACITVGQADASSIMADENGQRTVSVGKRFGLLHENGYWALSSSGSGHLDDTRLKLDFSRIGTTPDVYLALSARRQSAQADETPFFARAGFDKNIDPQTQITKVPAPASLPLLLAGFGTLAICLRLKRG